MEEEEVARNDVVVEGAGGVVVEGEATVRTRGEEAITEDVAKGSTLKRPRSTGASYSRGHKKKSRPTSNPVMATATEEVPVQEAVVPLEEATTISAAIVYEA